MASRGPPPCLQFICIFSYLGFNSLRTGEGGLHSYSKRGQADIRNLKRQESSSNARKFTSCKQQTPVLFQGQEGLVGGGGQGGQGEEGRKQAYFLVICT